MGQKSVVKSNPVVVMGRVGAPYGVKGWVHVQSYTQPPRNLMEYPRWLLVEGDDYRVVKPSVRWQGDHCVAKWENCETREAAAAYTNLTIGVLRSELPPLTEDDHYWADLIGLWVVTEEGHILGEVEYLFETGANDVMSVKGKKEHLIPYSKEYIVSIDLDAGLMKVRWDPEF